MGTKIGLLLAATLILGSASTAAAEDSSTSFTSLNVYSQAGQQRTLTSRNVALTNSRATYRAGNFFGRASQVRDGGGN